MSRRRRRREQGRVLREIEKGNGRREISTSSPTNSQLETNKCWEVMLFNADCQRATLSYLYGLNLRASEKKYGQIGFPNQDQFEINGDLFQLHSLILMPFRFDLYQTIALLATFCGTLCCTSMYA